jgi:hypothetical protein
VVFVPPYEPQRETKKMTQYQEYSKAPSGTVRTAFLDWIGDLEPYGDAF